MLTAFLAQLPWMTIERAHLVLHAFWPMFRAGILVSVPLAVVSFLCGLVIALAVAVIKTMPQTGRCHRVLVLVLNIYVSIIRGTPLLVQLCVVFYGFPALGIELNPIPTAIIGFSLNIGAYASEIIRAAILSLPKGQWEAGFSIGMTYMQTLRRIILPQASRVAVPPLSNTFIGLFKDTSLAAVVTVTELFREAQQAANQAYDFLPVFIEAGLIYWLFCAVLFSIQSRLEKKLSHYMY